MTGNTIKIKMVRYIYIEMGRKISNAFSKHTFLLDEFGVMLVVPGPSVYNGRQAKQIIERRFPLHLFNNNNRNLLYIIKKRKQSLVGHDHKIK